ncbi:MAG: hypothetical protein VYE73_11695, partial [Acidobacteriota bacterium]|nr:hypothetical protein [Acidobacteriota bacterium]
MPLPFKLARVFLTMHLRDRQALVFSMFFPIASMVALGLFSGAGGDPIDLGLVRGSGGELAAQFIAELEDNPFFTVQEGDEQALRASLIEGDLQMVLVLPEHMQDRAGANELRLLVDPAQTRQLGLLLPIFEKALGGVERELRGNEPLFSL